jgi:ssDNA-binding Zn-finger/Zn-ribbon topoisomerase 1
MSTFTFKHCPNCGADAVTRRNHGRFYGCFNFFTTGCGWSASPTTGEQWGVNSTVARASKKRSRANSRKALVIPKLQAKFKWTREEAERCVNDNGLFEAERLAA